MRQFTPPSTRSATPSTKTRPMTEGRCALARAPPFFCVLLASEAPAQPCCNDVAVLIIPGESAVPVEPQGKTAREAPAECHGGKTHDARPREAVGHGVFLKRNVGAQAQPRDELSRQ